jgi:hypothetical protein
MNCQALFPQKASRRVALFALICNYFARSVDAAARKITLAKSVCAE